MNYSQAEKDNKGQLVARKLIVLPDVQEEHVSESGFLIPEDAAKTYETGKVFAATPGSYFKKGDSVQYALFDRKNPLLDRNINIDGLDYDIIAEHEVWSVNDEPYNFLFIKTDDSMKVTESGLEIPASALGYPQNGIVVFAPDHSLIKTGSKVAYRKKEMGLYNTAIWDNEEVDVMPESYILMVDDMPSPYRILVKIDILAQQKSRTETSGGMQLNSLYAGMRYNLQYAEVVSIGSQSKSIFTQLAPGDEVIMSHLIESDAHRWRLIKEDKNAAGDQVLFEYRVIEADDINNRLIYGKIEEYEYCGLKSNRFISFGDNVFLQWKFSMFERNSACASSLIQLAFDIPQFDNVVDLKSGLEKKIKEVSDTYGNEWEQQKATIMPLNPEEVDQRDYADKIESAMLRSQKEYHTNMAKLREDILIKCRQISPALESPYVIANWIKGLYPIEVKGVKFLIAQKTQIIGSYNSNAENEKTMYLNKFQANGDKLLVRPVETESKGDLSIAIPDESKLPPVTGIVLSAGPNVQIAGDGDTVYFRMGTGRRTPVDGEELLMLTDKDIELVMKK